MILEVTQINTMHVLMTRSDIESVLLNWIAEAISSIGQIQDALGGLSNALGLSGDSMDGG